MLNARWLETFVTLCETGHFTRAAEQLHMTQPGVSQHLKKLEAQIGQPLISRDGKSFTRTPAGEAVLALGRERRAGERALHEALGADDPDVGKVTLACSRRRGSWMAFCLAISISALSITHRAMRDCPVKGLGPMN